MAVATVTLFLTHSRRLPYPSFHCTHPSPSSSFPPFSISLHRSQSPFLTLLIPSRLRRFPGVLAVAENERNTVLSESDLVEEEKTISGGVGASDETKLRVRPCELYVCNLPRSYDISHLLELFKPYGTVQSVEVSRDPETGISRGCGFVTMGSISEAKYAIAALDGSDIAGREMRVNFSVDMVSGRKNVEALNSAPKKNFLFESPYKIYVGNLSWSTRPEDLREHFSQFGTVVSTRVLHDRKRGKNRVYAFLSFSSPDAVRAATKADGSELYGRVMLVREGHSAERKAEEREEVDLKIREREIRESEKRRGDLSDKYANFAEFSVRFGRAVRFGGGNFFFGQRNFVGDCVGRDLLFREGEWRLWIR